MRERCHYHLHGPLATSPTASAVKRSVGDTADEPRANAAVGQRSKQEERRGGAEGCWLVVPCTTGRRRAHCRSSNLHGWRRSAARPVGERALRVLPPSAGSPPPVLPCDGTLTDPNHTAPQLTALRASEHASGPLLRDGACRGAAVAIAQQGFRGRQPPVLINRLLGLSTLASNALTARVQRSTDHEGSRVEP